MQSAVVPGGAACVDPVRANWQAPKMAGMAVEVEADREVEAAIATATQAALRISAREWWHCILQEHAPEMTGDFAGVPLRSEGMQAQGQSVLGTVGLRQLVGTAAGREAA